MNTRKVIRNLEWFGGGLALLSLAGAAYVIGKRFNHRYYSRNFDPETVEELTGKIVEIGYSGEEGEEQGIYLIIESGEQMLPVHLGPAWFINRRDRRFRKGEKVKIIGSRTECDGEECMVAASIFSGDRMLELRSEEGVPYWSGWKKIA